MFSVLISVYYKEKTDYLTKALESIVNQTLLPDEIVLVEDGPLKQEQEEVISRFASLYKIFRIIKLARNQGLGKALNEGLKHCSYDLVARMDSDDISLPYRFEKQVSFMESHPEIDACSATINEFIDNPDNIISKRNLPETSEELYRFGKTRSPLNHPAVMFRKSAVLRAGGYQHFPLLEDYYLWVRMIIKGSRLYNLQEPLLLFRCSPNMYKRRGGLKYALTELKFQRMMHEIGYISLPKMITNSIIRFTARIIPNRLRSVLYRSFLHK